MLPVLLLLLLLLLFVCTYSEDYNFEKQSCQLDIIPLSAGLYKF